MHIALYLTFRLTAAGRRDDGVRREKLGFGFTVPVF